MSRTLGFLATILISLSASCYANGPSAPPVGAKPADSPHVDLEISGVRIGTPNSAFKEQIEKGVKEVGVALWGIALASSDGTEVLTLLRYPGGYEFGDAILSRSDEVMYKLQPQKLDSVKSFKSGLGIHLGMPEQKVKKILGSNYRVKDSDTQPGRTRIRYEIPIHKAPKELKEINMPLYYIDISFEDGKLDRYQIGFEQP